MALCLLSKISLNQLYFYFYFNIIVEFRDNICYEYKHEISHKYHIINKVSIISLTIKIYIYIYKYSEY